MRLVRHRTADGVRAGLLDGDRVIDLAGTTVVELLALDPSARATRVREAAAAGSGSIALADADLDAPVERPGKLLALGFNFADHAAEGPVADDPRVAHVYERVTQTKAAYPTSRFPLVFNKQTTCIAGPHDDILLPDDAEMLDYEGELAIVVGRRGRRVDVAQAASMIAGYTVCDDVSIRDWQVDTQTMWPGKSYDTHGPLGPCVVTADEIDVSDLALRTWVNGEIRQDATTASMVLDPAEVVSVLSQLCTLEPGDVIATGTPGGIGTPSGRFLAAGDVVRVEIEGIGALENTVVAERVPAAFVPDRDG